MSRTLSFAFLALLMLSSCAAPASSMPTEVPTASPIPTSAEIPNCGRVEGRLQLPCIEPVTGLSYWLYLPPDLVEPSTAELPLLIYLHGFSHSGSDLDLLLYGGVPAEIEKGRRLPMLVASPQCPYGENWQSEKMVERISRFVDALISAYPIDPHRVYLTGFSMGGDGAWALAKAHPGQFAALAPVSSDWYVEDPQELCVLKDLPIWVFQSRQDELVSDQYARQNVARIGDCGGTNIELSLFPSGGHEATARQVYAMDGLYQWFLDHK